MATSTARNTIIKPEESTFGKMMKELERKLCFTDVPCGAMEFKKETPQNNAIQGTNKGWLRHFENALCFADLKDLDAEITQKDLERIETMKTLVDDVCRDTPPRKSLVHSSKTTTEDTDSCTDDSDESKPKTSEESDESHGIELKVKPDVLDDSMDGRVLSAESDEEKMPGQIVVHDIDNKQNDDKGKDDEDDKSVGSASAEMSAVTLPSFMLFTPLRKRSKKDAIALENRRRAGLKTSLGKFTKRAMRSRGSILKQSKEMKYDSKDFDLNSKDIDTTEKSMGSNKRWMFRKTMTTAKAAF